MVALDFHHSSSLIGFRKWDLPCACRPRGSQFSMEHCIKYASLIKTHDEPMASYRITVRGLTLVNRLESIRSLLSSWFSALLVGALIGSQKKFFLVHWSLSRIKRVHTRGDTFKHAPTLSHVRWGGRSFSFFLFLFSSVKNRMTENYQNRTVKVFDKAHSRQVKLKWMCTYIIVDIIFIINIHIWEVSMNSKSTKQNFSWCLNG